MIVELQTLDTRKRFLYSTVGAFLMAILVFLTIPLTQTIQPEATEIVDLRKIIIVQPSAPPTPPETTKQPTAKEKPLQPSFQKQLIDPDLTQLALSLNPGIEEALEIGLANTGFEMEMDTVGEIKKLFTFRDLPEAPKIINHPKILFPRELVRRGIKEGRVVVLIEIDERGRARVISIQSSTHPLLIKKAEEVIRQAQFTTPLINGVAQRVRGEWPINLREPK